MLENDECMEHIEEQSSKHEAAVQENYIPIEQLQNREKELKDTENEERKAKDDQIEGLKFGKQLKKRRKETVASN